MTTCRNISLTEKQVLLLKIQRFKIKTAFSNTRINEYKTIPESVEHDSCAKKTYIHD